MGIQWRKMEDDPVAYLSEKKYRSFKEAGSATSFASYFFWSPPAHYIFLSHWNQYLDGTIKNIDQGIEKDNIIFPNFYWFLLSRIWLQNFRSQNETRWK